MLTPSFLPHFSHVEFFPFELFEIKPMGTQSSSIHTRDLVSGLYSSSWLVLALYQWSSQIPLKGYFFTCRGVSEHCPLELMPPLLRNASWVPVSWLRDCGSFLFSHTPDFLSIFFLNAQSSARDQRDTALHLSPCLHLAPPLAASQHHDFLTPL